MPAMVMFGLGMFTMAGIFGIVLYAYVQWQRCHGFDQLNRPHSNPHR